jgi:hypothetical protein
MAIWLSICPFDGQERRAAAAILCNPFDLMAGEERREGESRGREGGGVEEGRRGGERGDSGGGSWTHLQIDSELQWTRAVRPCRIIFKKLRKEHKMSTFANKVVFSSPHPNHVSLC